jgi:transposase
MVPRMQLDGLVLTDELWSRIAPLIPDEGRRPGLDPRMMVEAILWLARYGAPWSALPREFGWPPTV